MRNFRVEVITTLTKLNLWFQLTLPFRKLECRVSADKLDEEIEFLA